MHAKKRNMIPVRSGKFWVILLLLYVTIVILTMAKDLWLTGNQPNVLFYIIVPAVSILLGVVAMFAGARLTGQSLTFLELLAISIGANTIMQVVENLSKITYYLVWEYPGMLYVFFVLPLGFMLMSYGLMRWGKVEWWLALVLGMVDFVGGMAGGILMTEVIGLTTPGS